jgi:hypothetical protein
MDEDSKNNELRKDNETQKPYLRADCQMSEARAIIQHQSSKVSAVPGHVNSVIKVELSSEPKLIEAVLDRAVLSSSLVDLTNNLMVCRVLERWGECSTNEIKERTGLDDAIAHYALMYLDAKGIIEQSPENPRKWIRAKTRQTKNKAAKCYQLLSR